jgi:hypothetical protein
MYLFKSLLQDKTSIAWLWGGVDGAVRVYDHTTGGLVHRLGHKVKGRVQVVDVRPNISTCSCTVTDKVLGGKHT